MGDKRVLLPFEVVETASEDVEVHSLSARSQMLALSQTGYLHWDARWYRQDGGELSDSDKALIEDWASKAEDELLAVVTAGSSDVPAPYWDNGTGADDVSSPEEQTWYGEVSDPDAAAESMDFTATLADWAITAFIAYSGNIGAAIAFHTIAPRFVLAWERGDVGEIFRIIVNAADYDTVDTSDASEGDVIRTSVQPEANENGYDILIVKVG